jgi:hypothetical protein
LNRRVAALIRKLAPEPSMAKVIRRLYLGEKNPKRRAEMLASMKRLAMQ